MNMLDLMMRLGTLTTELNRLLGMRFVPGHPGNNTPTGKALASLVPLWNAGRHSECELEVLRLFFLIKHLKEIEAADYSLLLHFRKEFRRAGTTSSSFGVRFEVYVAASLIRSGVKFVKSEAPDFNIFDSTLGIECTSVRISSSNKQDYSYKIHSTVKKKSESKSHRPEIALLIDVTNIAHNTENLDTSILRKAAFDSLKESVFGAVVLFIYMYNHDLQRLESNHIRIDSSHIQIPLRELLDQLFPVVKHEVISHQIPLEG